MSISVIIILVVQCVNVDCASVYANVLSACANVLVGAVMFIVKAFESEWKCWMPGLVLQTCLVTALPRNLAELGCGWYSYRLEI